MSPPRCAPTPKPTPRRINDIESRVKHDVIAFTMAVGESVGDPLAARWLHYGMTSNDVVDTAQALQIRDAAQIIERDLVIFGEVLDLRAHEFRQTPQIGRTHGIHAEPITFGLKIANWFAENQRNIGRLRDAAAQMAIGKISGAVGNASHLGPDIEARICKRLGLNVAPVASQVIQRDRHAQFVSTLALIAATLEKISTEIRHLAAHRSARSRRAIRRRAAWQFGDAAQTQPRELRADQRLGARRCAPTWSRRTKTSRSGTSATSRIARSSASSCPTRRFSSITCSAK